MTQSHSDYIFGLHPARHALTEDIDRVLEIWIQQGRTDQRIESLLELAKQQQLAVQIVPRKTLDKLSENGHHQGIVIRCRAAVVLDQADLAELLAAKTTGAPLLLVLDGIQDPHNLGACLRTADAAGVDAVIIPKNRACGLSATVRKVASGAAVPVIQVTNLAQTLQWLQTQGIWLIGTTDQAEQSVYDLSLTGAIAWVLGAEGDGLRTLTQNRCDYLAHLPMLGRVESLNVSVATGICLYETVRQRRNH
ncbi:23S rRNA (guanosine(2251)-2'-O)-methyltransferase RlmB [Thioflexithrix psekupsensis]|uniref:23S rRNA (guanosine-2'-O-)-methyltransferase RlmB n=1 Tax=Thioflexithrix psekupsensis TaxID=1570016 RepID=A0A251XAU8_9GAMM|nr:23S rRNA (guanosine(2251)-2'-O)-methyltransferase RlmB [Thioflexithrix psekupsensis]OUD15067.1 23S rRNA (guanosine(2251)-2'-O)-methyltransferase RlmB [Thioflexithrix psekupsensis]